MSKEVMEIGTELLKTFRLKCYLNFLYAVVKILATHDTLLGYLNVWWVEGIYILETEVTAGLGIATTPADRICVDVCTSPDYRIHKHL